MATNLLDAIKQNTSSLGTQQQANTDETGKLQTLLRAKSGRDVSGGDIGASSLGEQQAVASTNNQMQNQVAPAAAIQNADTSAANAAQQSSASNQQNQITQNRNIDNMQTRIKTNSILQDLEQGKGKIDQQQKDALTSQAAQNLRLQNQQYVDNLQREGSKARLDDQNSFNEALEQSVLGQNQQLLQSSLGNQSILNANDQAFKKAMGDMSVGNAYDVFQNAMANDKQRAIYTGVGTLVGAGAGAAGKMSSSSAPAAAEPAVQGSSASDYTSLSDQRGSNAGDYKNLP